MNTIADKLASFTIGVAFDKTATDSDRLAVIRFIHEVLNTPEDWEK